MAKADTWMPLYIADYLRKTMHLTRDQHGAYLLLLMACWDRGGRLPNDPGQLAGITRSTPAEWRRLSPVILPFFEEEGAFLIQGRVLEEHDKAERLAEARRENGRLGGRPKKLDAKQIETDEKPGGLANPNRGETPTRVALPSPSPPPNGGLEANASLSPGGDAQLVLLPEAPKALRTKGAYPPTFEALWLAYPHAKGRSSKSDSLKEWNRLPPADRDWLPEAATRYGREGREPKADCGAPALERWLKRRLFEHWRSAAPQSSPVDPLTLWRSRMVKFVESRFWLEKWGPEPRRDAPQREAVQVPAAVLAEFGFSTKEAPTFPTSRSATG